MLSLGGLMCLNRREVEMAFYSFTRKELKAKGARSFEHGDVILSSKYLIRIKYRNDRVCYSKPSLLSTVEDRQTLKILDCTPGIERPYYIDDFLHR